MNLIEQLKAHWVVITIALAVGSGYVYARELRADVDKLSEVASKQAALAVGQQELEHKMIEFVLNLWGIDPESRKRWREFPTKPTVTVKGDTLTGFPWVEFEGFDRLVMYHVVQDTTSKALKLLVDTLYEYRPKVEGE